MKAYISVKMRPLPRPLLHPLKRRSLRESRGGSMYSPRRSSVCTGPRSIADRVPFAIMRRRSWRLWNGLSDSTNASSANRSVILTWPKGNSCIVKLTSAPRCPDSQNRISGKLGAIHTAHTAHRATSEPLRTQQTPSQPCALSVAVPFLRARTLYFGRISRERLDARFCACARGDERTAARYE